MCWTLKTIRFWKQSFGENKIFSFSWVKIVLNFENKKNRFEKFENCFFSRLLEFFEIFFFFSMLFRILKIVFYAFQNLKNRFEIFQNDLKKKTFCPSLFKISLIRSSWNIYYPSWFESSKHGGGWTLQNSWNTELVEPFKIVETRS